MSVKKRLKSSQNTKSENHQVKLDEAIDLNINYDNSVTYFCSFLGKRHLVLNFDIQNKAQENLTLQLKTEPVTKMKKGIMLSKGQSSCNPSELYSKQIPVTATLDDSPFEIAANRSEKNQSIIVCDFNINSKLQLVVISCDDRMAFDIDFSRIK
jgi:hypothetical protein